MLNHLLVPLDGSSLAEAAIPYAKGILAPNGKITLVSVIQPPDAPIYDFYPAPMPRSTSYADDLKTATHYAHEYLERTADDLRADGIAAVSIHIETGDPAAEIVTVAERVHAETIVMSTHGRSGFSRWLFGSVTQKVLASTSCPILVIPGRTPSLLAEKTSTGTAIVTPTASHN